MLSAISNKKQIDRDMYRSDTPQAELKLWALFIALLALITCGALFLTAILKADRDAAIHRYCFADPSSDFYSQLYLDQSGRTIEWVIVSTEQVHSLAVIALTTTMDVIRLCDHSCPHNVLGTSTQVFPSNQIQAILDRPAFYGLQFITTSYNVTLPITSKC